MLYDEIEAEVRKLAHSLPPSDFGSTRAIQAVAHYVVGKLSAAGCPSCNPARAREVLGDPAVGICPGATKMVRADGTVVDINN